MYLGIVRKECYEYVNLLITTDNTNAVTRKLRLYDTRTKPFLRFVDNSEIKKPSFCNR
jgi:hypothetical protein